MHPTAPDTLYVAVYGSGVYKISNAKATTPTSTNIRTHTSQGRIALALSASKPSVLYAQFASTAGEPLAIDHSGNGGASGSWISGTIPPHDPQLSSFMNTQGWYDNTIAVNPADELTVYVAGVDSYQSADAGTTWTKMTSWQSLSAPYVHADIHDIRFASGSTFYIACDGGVYGTSSSGGSWSALSSGLSVTLFY